MPILVPLAGFLGAWLLVAGPVYQAAVELREEAVDQEVVHRATASVPPPPHPSAWWWLLPPVAFVKSQRAGREYREAVTRALPAGTVAQWVHFNEKATGWLLVGAGGTLLALQESWDLVEALGWWTWTFWPVVVGALLLSVGHTVARMRGARGIIDDAARPAPGAAEG